MRLYSHSDNDSVGEVAGVYEKDSDVAADGHVAGDIVGTHQSPECKWWVSSFPRRTAPTLQLLMELTCRHEAQRNIGRV